MHSSTLAQLVADWNAHNWPLTNLYRFRMEGEGGGEGGDGSQGGGGGDGGQGDGGETDVAKLQAELDKWKTQSRKHEDRAKANASAASELEKLKQSQMNDQEKAVAQARAEAKAEGRAEAIADLGPKVIAGAVALAAGGRLEAEQITTLVEGLNVAAFLTNDGEVDTDKVTKFVNGIAPARDDDDGQQQNNGSRFVDLGQGTRNGGGGGANKGDPLLRDVKAALGIR